jgi:hypothetical protein
VEHPDGTEGGWDIGPVTAGRIDPVVEKRSEGNPGKALEMPEFGLFPGFIACTGTHFSTAQKKPLLG